jgi:iron complex transport system substrate-binding protein
MRLAACALAVFLAVAQAPAADRMVTDSAGRQVAVPDRIARVFAAGPPAMVLLYVLAPDKMIGWPRAPHPDEMPYVAPEYRDLPEGRLADRARRHGQSRGAAAVQAGPGLSTSARCATPTSRSPSGCRRRPASRTS